MDMRFQIALTMWSILVEFRSASWEGTWRIKKERKKNPGKIEVRRQPNYESQYGASIAAGAVETRDDFRS